MKRKGQIPSLGNLPTIVLLLVVAGLVLTFASDVTQSISENFEDEETNENCANNGFNCTGAAVNVTDNVLSGLTGVGGQFGNVGTVIGAAVIIGILIAAFAFRGGNISLQ